MYRLKDTIFLRGGFYLVVKIILIETAFSNSLTPHNQTPNFSNHNSNKLAHILYHSS